MHNFVYDVEKSLYTLEGFPQNKHEFTVVLDDITSITSNRTTANGSSGTGVGIPNMRYQFQPEMVRLDLNYAAKIPMKAITDALCGLESLNSQEVLSVFDIILRQHASRKRCLLLGQSGLYGNFKNFTDPGGGVLECRSFHSVFITVQVRLSLNVEVSMTMTVQPGPIVNFLIANLGVRTPDLD